jgi:hypothetical protein
MRIMFCRKYNRYVSQSHCEIFNEGETCVHYELADSWTSIKTLLQDQGRPLWDVVSIAKPFNCTLMDHWHRGTVKRRGRHPGRATRARG